jgi:hypothetical protein
MGEAKRRQSGTQPLDHALGQFADSVLHGGGDAPTVAIGPIVWGIEQGSNRRVHSRKFNTSNRSGPRSDRLPCSSSVGRMRGWLQFLVETRRAPLV